MSTHDSDVANQSPALVRADFNNALLALVTNYSNATAPSNPVAYQWWVDTTNNLLKIRNAANSAWITVATPSISNFGFLSSTGGTFTGALLAAVGAVGAPGIAFDGDLDTGIYRVSANTWGIVSGGTEYLRISPSGITFLGTGALQLPGGTTGQRPTPATAMFRYNSTIPAIEVYVGGAWKQIAATSSYPFAVSDFKQSYLTGHALMRQDYSSFGSQSSQRAGMIPAVGNPSFTLISTYSTAGGECFWLSWAPNNEFLAIGVPTGSAIVQVLKRIGIDFGNYYSPSSSGTSRGGGFSPNGEWLFVDLNSTTDGFRIFQRTEGSSALNIATSPASVNGPTGQITGLSWSPNGEFVAYGYNQTGKLWIYQRSGGTFTKVTDPATMPTQVSDKRTHFSPDGRFLVCTNGSASPRFIIYERTAGNTFTKLSDPTGVNTLPNVTDARFSPDGQYLFVLATTGYQLFQRSGTTFTSVASSTSQSNRKVCDFSPDGKYIAIGDSANGTFRVVSATSPGTVVFSGTLPSAVAGSKVNDIKFSPDGQFLAIANNITSQYINIYQLDQDNPDSSVLAISRKLRAGT